MRFIRSNADALLATSWPYGTASTLGTSLATERSTWILSQVWILFQWHEFSFVCIFSAQLCGILRKDLLLKVDTDRRKLGSYRLGGSAGNAGAACAFEAYVPNL